MDPHDNDIERGKRSRNISISRGDVEVEAELALRRMSRRLSQDEFKVIRPPMNQEEFDKKFSYHQPKTESQAVHQIKKFVQHYYEPFRSWNLFKLTFISFFPIIDWMSTYSWKENIINDIVGGLTVGVMHVPQGIAYAVLAKVSPVQGLYTSLFPPLIYMIFGMSRHNSIGSFAVVSLMTGLAVERLTHVTSITENNADPNNTFIEMELTPMEVSSTLTFTAGLIMFIAAMLRLDFITTYFSDQVVGGFTTGASCHVFVSQLKDIFGLRKMPKRSGPGYLLVNLYDIFSRILDTNLICLATSVAAMFILVVGKDYINPFVKRKFKIDIPLPFELIVIILGTVASYFFHFSDLNIKIVKEIPTGFPAPTLPRFSLIPNLLADALGIAVVVVAIHISLAKMFAKKQNYEVESGQEFYALSFSSMGSAFMPVYPVACSLGRTLVNVGAGTKTQLSSVFSGLLVLSVILFFGRFLETLPMCILSAIVIVALKGMCNKFADLRLLWPLSKIDFSIWIVSFLTTVCIDVTEGLAISICYALFTTIMREQWPRWHLLGNVSGTTDYRDSERYEDVYFFHGICIFRFDSPILFTNVERFKKTVSKAFSAWMESHEYYVLRVEKAQILLNADVVDNEASIHKNIEDCDMVSRYFIIDCSGFTFVDYMGVSALKESFSEMMKRGVQVYFAAAKAPVRELFESSGFYQFVAKDNFFPTIRDAVAIARIRQKGKGHPPLHSQYSVEHDRLSEIISSQPMN